MENTIMTSRSQGMQYSDAISHVDRYDYTDHYIKDVIRYINNIQVELDIIKTISEHQSVMQQDDVNENTALKDFKNLTKIDHHLTMIQRSALYAKRAVNSIERELMENEESNGN